MSRYTNYLHDKAKADTAFWDAHNPENGQEAFDYAEYQRRLKDYKVAFEWFVKAADAHVICAWYRLGEASFFGYGCEKDLDKAKQYFSRFMHHAVPLKSDYETYFLGQCYMHGWGTEIDIPEAISLFRSLGNQCGDALHALGLIYQDLDAVQAKQYFLLALQAGCLKTPFALYEMYGFDLQHFPYKRELFEHFSFILGQLMRVAELHPCKEYYQRLGNFYETALPNDYEWNMNKFRELARKYYRLSQTCKS